MKGVAFAMGSWALVVGVPIIVYRITRVTNRSLRLLIALSAGALIFAVIDTITVQLLR